MALIPKKRAAVVGGGPAPFITAAAGPWFTAPAAIGTNNGQMYGEAILTLAALPAGAVTILALSATQISLQIQPTGAIRLTALKGNNNVTALATANPTTTLLLVAGTRHVIRYGFDLAGLTFRLWIDGAIGLDLALAANTGVLDATRTLSMLAINAGGATQVIGTIERLRLWKDVTSATNTPPASAPIKDIEGPAAAVNADRVALGVTAGWTLGADAVAA